MGVHLPAAVLSCLSTAVCVTLLMHDARQKADKRLFLLALAEKGSPALRYVGLPQWVLQCVYHLQQLLILQTKHAKQRAAA